MFGWLAVLLPLLEEDSFMFGRVRVTAALLSRFRVRLWAFSGGFTMLCGRV
jgi:hypothetical protein